MFSLRGLLLTSLALLVIKAALATQLPLLVDEAFTWQAGLYPAPAYSDQPFMTPLLQQLGAGLLGAHYLGSRWFFLLMAAAVPLLVWRLAKPLVPAQQALAAGYLSLCLPLVAGAGIIAVPDVPLLFFSLLGLLALQQAVATGSRRAWLLAGLATALGFCTHYRIAVWVLPALLFLLGSRPGRQHWRSSGPWLALFLMLAGLLPALWFNWQHDFAVLRFHFVDRHPWQFQWLGLAQPLLQALIVTPLLYGLLLLTAWRMAHSGDARQQLLLLFAAVPLLSYWLLGIGADHGNINLQWPLPAYLPLLPFLPSTLARLSRGWARSAVALGALGGAAGLLLLLATAWPRSAWQPLTIKAFQGWPELAVHARHFHVSHPADVLVVDSYLLAAELAFEVPELPPALVLDHWKNHKHGRALQYQLWQLDEAAISAADWQSGLLLMEVNSLPPDRRAAWRKHVCASLPGLRLLGRKPVLGGRRELLAASFQRGRQGCELPETDQVAIK